MVVLKFTSSLYLKDYGTNKQNYVLENGFHCNLWFYNVFQDLRLGIVRDLERQQSKLEEEISETQRISDKNTANPV